MSAAGSATEKVLKKILNENERCALRGGAESAPFISVQKCFRYLLSSAFSGGLFGPKGGRPLPGDCNAKTLLASMSGANVKGNPVPP